MNQTKQNFNFGEAIQYLKNDFQVCRNGWNGKGMFLTLVKGSMLTAIIAENTKIKDEQNKPYPVQDAIYMKTADNKLIAWLASQADILAEDWEIFYPSPKND
jgi:hypothetical protein